MMRSVFRAAGLGTMCVLLLLTLPVVVVPASAGATVPVGSVLAFGSNACGELGSTTNLRTFKPNPTPTVVSLPGAQGSVTQAAAGDCFSLVLTSTGQVFAFGDNYYGQLGNTTNVGRLVGLPNPTPTLVRFPGIEGKVTKVAAGGSFSLALSSSGQLYGFGSDAPGDLGRPPAPGTGSHDAEPTPALITLPGLDGFVTQIAAGLYHSLVLSSTGQLYAFGYNWWGQLGSTTNVSTYKANSTPTVVSLPGIQGHVTGIAAGANFSLALTSAGQLYAFGDNTYGQLGNTTNIGKLTANPTPTPVTIPGLAAKVTQIAAGGYHSLALTSTGQLYAFGANEAGQLGNTTDNGDTGYVAHPTPTLVSFPSLEGHITQVAGGEGDSLAVTSSGQLYAFGSDAGGELGIMTTASTGTSEPHPTPTPVDLPAGTRISSVAVGSFASQTLAVVGGGQQISGTLTDANGKGLAGAEVDVTGTDTDGNTVSTKAFTDTAGNYQVALGAGTYTVRPTPPTTPGMSFAAYVCSGSIVPKSAACEVLLNPGDQKTASFKLISLVVNSTRAGVDKSELDQAACDITPGEPRQTCTLAQAIAIYNADGGGPVTFDIPHGSGNVFVDGVPRIDEPGNTLRLYNGATVDATTQPGSHRVELSGPGDPNTVGLWAPDGETAVRGMVIRGYSVALELGSFQNQAGDVEAPGRDEEVAPPSDFKASPQAGDTVQSDTIYSSGALEFRWEPSGEATEEAGLLVLRRGGGQIGGPGPGQGNTFYAPLLQQDVTGSVVQGNTFTSDAGASNGGDALALEDGGGNTVGGTQPGAGNTLDEGGMLILENHDVVQANTMESLFVDGSSNTIGGATSSPGEAPGNRVIGYCPSTETCSGTGIFIGSGYGADGNVVQGNEIKGFVHGIVLGNATQTTIGGPDKRDGDLIKGPEDAGVTSSAGVTFQYGY